MSLQLITSAVVYEFTSRLQPKSIRSLGSLKLTTFHYYSTGTSENTLLYHIGLQPVTFSSRPMYARTNMITVPDD